MKSSVNAFPLWNRCNVMRAVNAAKGEGEVASPIHAPSQSPHSSTTTPDHCTHVESLTLLEVTVVIHVERLLVRVRRRTQGHRLPHAHDTDDIKPVGVDIGALVRLL